MLERQIVTPSSPLHFLQMARPREKYWYALKVFYNRVEQIRDIFKAARYETFAPSVIPSLLFVKCSEEYLVALKREHWDKFMYYKDAEGKHPGSIQDHEMEVFITALSNPAVTPEYLGEDTEKYMTGDAVRITDGPYKGYEGFICRIKHDRKLVVCVRGVAVVGFSDVKMEYVEKK